MRQYSADGIKVSWFGVDISSGLAQGTFIQIARTSPSWTIKSNGVGGIVRMYNPDRSGTADLQIDAESSVHQSLITLANSDDITRSIVGPMVVRDLSTQEVVLLNRAFILSIPVLTKGTQSSVFSWSFGFETEIVQSFDFNANAVGT